MNCNRPNSRRRSCRLETLEDRRLLAVTGAEQEFVYWLNRARNDPSGYEQAQNLPVSLSSIQPRGPLAINNMLANSADIKSSDMAVRDYFSHVSPSGVHANQLVTNTGYQLPSYFPC